ncbi:G2/mitotic-specific cyclin-A-like [Uloborus diversus]|uniref:G2/mitotic-specific cyclin-A-like n=1 Tax=Uloborus diversus TaxID=327109 RepID=UPI00240A1354|nr:G2/mitotic-specific cyclin-A-like [Uloborus diversus]
MAECSPLVKKSITNAENKHNVHRGPSKRPALADINGKRNISSIREKICLTSIEDTLTWAKQNYSKIRVLGSQKFSIYEDDCQNENLCLLSNVSRVIDLSPVKTITPTYSCDKTSKDLSKIKIDEAADLVWSSPYREDVYSYLKELQHKFRPRPTYMSKQQDITLSMRTVLVDWLVEVGEEYRLQVETLHLAVSYVDRFLSRMSVLRAKLQLVGTASMFIASKYEEIYPPELKDFVYITDDTYTKKQILRMEHLVLKVLAFDIASPTAYAFLRIFCCMSSASDTVSYLAQYICELSLLEAEPFLTFLPSVIGAASLALANYTLGHIVWSEDLAELSGYQLNDLKNVMHCLHKVYSSVLQYEQKAIYDKYKSSRFLNVSSIESPVSLSL